MLTGTYLLHKDWELAGMYSDEGISGTSTKHRIDDSRT